MTQKEQVIEAMRSQGGYATLRRLNEILDFSTWGTLTPEASVRRIVQVNSEFFRIQPGLWALSESRQAVLEKFNILPGNQRGQELFSHSYYQGLLVEIGNLRRMITYVPAQDQHHMFIDRELGDVATCVRLPKFSYDELLRSARTVDVIWFNERGMPSHLYEVEHTTDIKNSLTKFYELQDFCIKFFIVADVYRKSEFNDKVSASIFSPIKDRVKFMTYEEVATIHSSLLTISSVRWL